MRFVDRPTGRPATCAIIPGRGAAAEKGRWLDTHNELPGFDPHIYISEAGGCEVARMLGWTSPTDALEMRDENLRLGLRVRELEDELSASEAVFQAIDSLESEGFRARKKPGRPKAKATTGG